MKIGIIGAGTMGAGIAQAFAQVEGYEVCLCDLNIELAQRGKQKIKQALEHIVQKGKITEETMQNILSRIVVGVKEDCGNCNLILEAAVENLKIKQETFRELDNICPENCIFTTNTSSLSITEIGSGIGRPVIGMHFFNPAPVMKLVEIIQGLDTPREQVENL